MYSAQDAVKTLAVFFPVRFLVTAALWFSVMLTSQALPQKLGDLDEDGQATVLDLVRLINHINGKVPLSSELALYADLNEDGLVNQIDADLLANAVVGIKPLSEPPLTRIRESSPVNGEAGVAVIRETIVRFTFPLATNAVVTANNFYAGFGGRRLLSRVELSTDRRTATLFYLEPLPGSARVYAVFDGTGLTDFLARPLDPDGDGAPGGAALIAFDTLSLTALPGTAVIGRVFASELAPGTSNTNSVNRPLQGVTITVDGMEQTLRTVTDATGNFKLEPVPPGRFFVKIDGRTAVGSQWPDGAYYPYVGKAWDAVAGRTDNLAGGTGEIFLPLITPGTLQPVSQTTDTTVTFPTSVLASNPALAGVSITVPANALFSDDGTRGGKVGIAPVPADRLPGPLPPGLELPIVITVQTDGPLNFDKPAPVCFPNLADPETGIVAPPGSKQWLISFNHKKGIWEGVGSMTVSADGKFVCTDPGIGILQPGWHGVGPKPLDPPPPPPPPCAEACGCGGGGGGGGPAPANLQSTSNGPTLPGETPLGKCIRRCKEDKLTGLAGCELGLISALAGCLAAGPGYGVCAAVAGAGYVICAGLVSYAESICEVRCKEDNPPCPQASSLSTSPVQTEERGTAALLSAPPSGDDLVLEQIGSILMQINMLLSPYALGGNPLPQNTFNQVNTLLTQANSLAGGDALKYLQDYLFRAEEAAAPIEAKIGDAKGNAPAYPVLYMAEVERSNGDILRLRGETQPFGQYSIFVPRDGALRYVSFYDPRSKSYGIVFPHVHTNAQYALPRFTLMRVDGSFPDSDRDGLPDVVEYVYGTDPNNPDSDGDGVKDGAEVDQGTNPLDGRPTQTGIIATASTPGTAVDVSALNDLVAVADSSAGVSLFSVVAGSNPTLIAQVATPGAAKAIAFAGNLLAVAADTAGLVVVNVSNPRTAGVTQRVSLGGSARAVVTVGATAFVGLSAGQIAVVDMATGTVLERATVPGLVHDLAVEGDRLFVLLDNELRAYQLGGASLTPLGKASTSSFIPEGITGRKRLFVGGGYAYTTSYPGYDVFDVRDPAAIVMTGAVTQGGPNSFKQIVANGSGLGVAAVGINPRNDGTHDINLYDLSNPAVTSQFLTTLPTPGTAYAVTIQNGLAYVADGDAGLQVMNYLAYDAAGKPPTIALSANFSLNPPQAEEGKSVFVSAQATDDVQVRNVEFYIDGVKVATDGNFPFEHHFTTPLLTVSRTSFTVRALATDTGGNTASTADIAVQLLPDSTPPTVSPLFPTAGQIAGSVDNVAVRFSEPIDPATVTGASFRLIATGADGLFGTADDSVVARGVISYRDTANAAFLSFGAMLPAGFYRAIISPPIADLKGNAMRSGIQWTFRVIAGVDSDHDGLPDDVEIQLGLDPFNSDSNGNGIPDGLEDLDGDGLSNVGEIIMGTDPKNPHSIDPNILDGNLDRDGDGLTDAQEIRLGTNPFLADTDGDGWNDEAEVTTGSDPLDADSTPELTVVARPPVAFVLIGEGDGAGFVTSLTVAQPSLALVLMADDNRGGVAGGLTVAQPPVTIELTKP